jgi:Xaa-Pro aminopeptidase
MDRTSQRRDRLVRQLRRLQLPLLIVSNPLNVTYLTGFTGDSSYLLLGPEHLVLVSDGRYATQIEEECPALDTYIRATTGERMPEALQKVIGRMPFDRVGVESQSMSLAEYSDLQRRLPRVAMTATDGLVEELRQCKDAGEVAEIRRAIGMAERAFQMFRASLRPGDTEKEAADAMEQYLRRAGAESSAFATIVGVGGRAALPHGRPSATTIPEQGLVLVDWGAAAGYHSDLTRVLAIRRIPTKLRAAHEVVLRAQDRAIRSIRPGAVAKNIDAEARAVIEESGFGPFFNHGTGHGIGLEIHEAPALRPNSDTVLKPGMVVTVEPGIYLPGLGGIRIEDDVLVTRDGCEVLSSLPRTLDELTIS